MTDEQFIILKKLYEEAQSLKNMMARSTGTIYAEYRMEFDKLNALDYLLDVQISPQKKNKFKEKIEKVRHEVLRATNGTVNLTDDTITRIIEKSVL